ncbi:anti-sigma factor [Edaphobacter sp.]|uniref:anti-sigma factor n=1 Tax=Edaphobacter sp. TaxID=1934404 RepID=UPI002DBD0EA0|nr:anti-sigma factor [Edaphobacter sp.]HEU5340447.1 anti-sigma factor [Edaphobacter sp.]
MNTARHFEPEDLALFAMQLLPQDEAAAVAAHVEQCAACRQNLTEVQGDLAAYAHTVDLHTPSAEARERLLKQVAREKKTIPIDRVPEKQESEHETIPLASYGRGLGRGEYLPEEDPPHRRPAGRLLPWLGWAAAAALAFAAGNLYQQRDALRSIIATQSSTMNQALPGVAEARQVMEALTDPTAKRVVLNVTPTEKPTPQGRATYVASRGTLIFVADNLEPLPPAKVYELWLIPASGAAPVPAGTFQPDAKGHASVLLPTLPKGVEAKAFGVTIEAEGGATKPTLPIILAGE